MAPIQAEIEAEMAEDEGPVCRRIEEIRDEHHPERGHDDPARLQVLAQRHEEQKGQKNGQNI